MMRPPALSDSPAHSMARATWGSTSSMALMTLLLSSFITVAISSGVNESSSIVLGLRCSVVSFVRSSMVPPFAGDSRTASDV